MDSSKQNLPRSLLEAGYRLPPDNAHYPQGLLSCLYRLRSRIPVDVDLAAQGDERKAAPHGFLRTPAQGAHQSPDVVNVIAHTEPRLDGLCDACARPQVGAKSGGNGAFEQQFLQLVLLSIRQFGRPPGGGLGPQGLGALLAIGRTPATHTAAIDLEHRGDFMGLISVFEQLHCALATALKGFRASGLPAGLMVHLLPER